MATIARNARYSTNWLAEVDRNRAGVNGTLNREVSVSLQWANTRLDAIGDLDFFK